MTADDGLREAIALAIYASDFGDSGDWEEERDTFQGEYRANADAVVALPEVATLRAKAAAADRVRECIDGMDAIEVALGGLMYVHGEVHRALDGQP